MALQVNPFRVSQPGTFLSTSSDGKLYLTLLPLPPKRSLLCRNLRRSGARFPRVGHGQNPSVNKTL